MIDCKCRDCGKEFDSIKQKKVYLRWETIQKYVNEFCDNLKEKPKYICGIPRGGLIIATLMSYKLDIPLINISDDIDFSVEDILIVDDIADSGVTLTRFLYGKDKPFGIYTLCYKEKSRVKPQYSIPIKEKEWVVFPWEVE